MIVMIVNENLKQEAIWSAIEVLADRIKQHDKDLKMISEMLKQND